MPLASLRERSVKNLARLYPIFRHRSFVSLRMAAVQVPSLSAGPDFYLADSARAKPHGTLSTAEKGEGRLGDTSLLYP